MVFSGLKNYASLEARARKPETENERRREEKMANKQMSSIAGLDQKMEQVLKEKANVKSFKELYDATRTPAARAALAEKTNLPLANITHWSVQAELLRMDGMTQDEACDLIDAGIYSVNDFNKLSNKEIIEKVRKANSDTVITEEIIEQIKKSKLTDAQKFDAKDVRKKMVVEENEAPSMYSDLSDVIAELGKGIARAQKALDESSIEIQNEILKDDRLYAMGLQATWYAMPEAEFTLKMDYAVSQTKSVSGKTELSKLSVAPSNATFQNLFKSDKKEESTLRLKFVPIPATDKMLRRRYMPDLSQAATVNEIKEILEEAEIENYRLLPSEAYEWGDERIRETVQSIPPATILDIGAVPQITVTRDTKK